jgi:hypothetical protein
LHIFIGKKLNTQKLLLRRKARKDSIPVGTVGVGVVPDGVGVVPDGDHTHIGHIHITHITHITNFIKYESTTG